MRQSLKKVGRGLATGSHAMCSGYRSIFVNMNQSNNGDKKTSHSENCYMLSAVNCGHAGAKKHGTLDDVKCQSELTGKV